MGRLIDISPRVSPVTAVWPGDVPFERQVALSLAAGDTLELSAIRSTVHVGAHADAPSHYHVDGRAIDAQPLEPYCGPCQVLEVRLPRGARILPEHLDAALGAQALAPRVLFKTGSFPDPDAFNEDFNSLSPELVERLHAGGCVLVGIDTPSVDPFASKALESHQALYRTGMANLEGVVLDAVSPGRYTLLALPLKLAGCDASPVRAVLVEGALD
ncbi:MAG: cyclase family protein [Planctomycetes bacterium]|nr:cyclase family protein [Planctomycetota bacterium]